MRRIGMGLVGPGFVGAHHVDAVRRLGFVDVVAIAASSEASARGKAEALGIPKAYASYEALAADPDVHVVHAATPNHLHGPVIRAALANGKHVISEKPLANSADEARMLLRAARDAGVVHAVMFNYRGNPLVQQARAMVAGGEAGPIHFVQGGYAQDWLLEPTDFSWRLEPDKGGPSGAVADIGSHWCDLVQHVVGARIEAVLADLTTVVKTRLKPASSPEAFSQTSLSTPAFRGRRLVEPTLGADPATTRWRNETSPTERPAEFTVESEDLAAILLRFDNGAKGCVTVGQVCAGHKNDLWFEVNGSRASLGWRQERQNELWIGRRHEPNATLAKDPALLSPAARAYTGLPGGHQEAWADAFCNVLKDVYGFIRDGKRPSDPKPPAFSTFEDGYRATCIVDAALRSHDAGGEWTTVRT